MKSRIVHDWPSDQFKVWLYRRMTDGDVLVLRLQDRLAHDWERQPANVDPGPPTLTLPEEALRALVAEASDPARQRYGCRRPERVRRWSQVVSSVADHGDTPIFPMPIWKVGA